jgi:DNA-binding transcriptional regulator LsrR (DeoR family)
VADRMTLDEAAARVVRLEAARAIRRMWMWPGWSQEQIAEFYGISRANVRALLKEAER